MHPPPPKNEWHKIKLKPGCLKTKQKNKQFKIIEHPFLS
ncbi:hypothetical protein HPHPH4_0206 [Helicobacter pylori Hp H-4]|nr:hypothetical protein HPHPH4_0206 [Helicobacter pylori Hp H-4]